MYPYPTLQPGSHEFRPGFHVSLLLASRGPLVDLERTLSSARRMAAHPESVEIILRCDHDDPVLPGRLALASAHRATAVVGPSWGYLSQRAMNNQIAALSHGRWLLPFDDDAEFVRFGWDAALPSADGVLIAQLGPSVQFLAVTRAWYDALGSSVYGAYPLDTWLDLVLRETGVPALRLFADRPSEHWIQSIARDRGKRAEIYRYVSDPYQTPKGADQLAWHGDDLLPAMAANRLRPGLRHRFLVVGAAGDLGSVLVRQLLARGDSVDAVDVGDLAPLRPWAAEPRLRVLRSIPDDAGYRRAINLAGARIQSAGASDGADLAAALSDRFDERVVYASTCGLYGKTSEAVGEDATIHLTTPYEQAKRRGEELTLNQRGTVLRFGVLVGHSPAPRYDTLPNELARSAALGQPMAIRAPGAYRPLLHVEDAASAIWHVSVNMVAPLGGGVFNAVGENLDKAALAQMAGCATTTQPGADLKDYKASAQKLGETGWSAKRTVQDALDGVRRAVLSEHA